MVLKKSALAQQGKDHDLIHRALTIGVMYERDEDDRPLTIPSHEELRSAWEDRRGELLPEFIAENPGQRPWGWWQFDSPEPIRPRYNWPLHVEHRINGVRKRDRWKPCPGSQLAFLERHGLLGADEIKALASR